VLWQLRYRLRPSLNKNITKYFPAYANSGCLDSNQWLVGTVGRHTGSTAAGGLRPQGRRRCMFYGPASRQAVWDTTPPPGGYSPSFPTWLASPACKQPELCPQPQMRPFLVLPRHSKNTACYITHPYKLNNFLMQRLGLSHTSLHAVT
jgi:hypothetical protein